MPRNPKSLIVIATHLERSGPLLQSPFREVYRGKKPPFLSLTFQKEKHYRYFVGANLPKGVDAESWSELGAFLSIWPNRSLDAVGLFHYRCTLSLSQKLDSTWLDFRARSLFYEQQADYGSSYAKDILFVPDPLVFETSAWEEFANGDAHIGLLPLLEEACALLDGLLEVDLGFSENTLKDNNFLFARNLFFGPAKIGRLWAGHLGTLMRFLSTRRPEGCDPRWGAYILERLFSVFVTHCELNNIVPVVRKQTVFFY